MTTKLYYNVTGQTLVWDAPEGRPDTVTSVAVYPASTGDDGTAESATTGSATVETNPDTTFDAASGDGQADPRKCNLTATTGIVVGRQYLVTNSTGETEWVEVREIASADYVIARNPLANAYAASDTFESTRISISVDSTWIADEANISADSDPNPGYRVRWVYVKDSVTYVHDDYFDVVRYSGEDDVTPEDVDAESPGWINRLPTYHREDRGARLIDAAADDVHFDFFRYGFDDSMVRNREVKRKLVIKRAVLNQVRHSVDGGRAEFVPALEVARADYDALLMGLVTVTNKTAMDVDAEGGASVPTVVSLLEK